ncbi:PAS domain-containing protein [bacterium]|nr:PAS domain-containing protein [bacterium]
MGNGWLLEPSGAAVVEDARAVVADALCNATRGDGRRFECDVACADGENRRLSFQSNLHFDSFGRVDGVCLIGFDLTERRLAERALRDREEMYSLAMRGPNEGLWDWNPLTKELYLSARLLSILGFEGDTLRTTSHEWLKLVHADDRSRYEAAVTTRLKGVS